MVIIVIIMIIIIINIIISIIIIIISIAIIIIIIMSRSSVVEAPVDFCRLGMAQMGALTSMRWAWHPCGQLPALRLALTFHHHHHHLIIIKDALVW